MNEMLGSFELIFGALVVLNAFLFFYSPLLVIISLIICFALLLFKWKYNGFKSQTNVRQRPNRLRPESSSDSSYGAFGHNSNIRVIKSARRQLSLQSRNTDYNNKNLFEHNLMSKFDTNHMNANYFGKSDGLLSSMSSQSYGSRPQSSQNQTPYETAIYNMRDTYSYESPTSQLGNIPRVKLTPTSDSIPHELNLKNKGVIKPVTIKIAPMPTHMSSKFTLNRMSNMNSSTASTFANSDTNKANPSTQTKTIVEALKLKRKRGQKQEFETEESFKISSNKKAKRDASINSSFNSPKIPNGLMPSQKQSVKRTSAVGTTLMPKRVKNNEILSSYSSLQTPDSGQTLKNKRKLSPESSDRKDVKSKRSLMPDEMSLERISPSNSVISSEDIKEVEQQNNLLFNSNEVMNKSEEVSHKKSYGLPLHLHTMEDHEHDKNKARNRLSRFLNAIQEVTSPKSEQKIDKVITAEVTQTISTSEIGLPSVPSQAIFTNSRVETSVTTTLLNSPITSILTTSRESLTPRTHVVNSDNNIDNSDNCSMTSAPNSPEVSTMTTPFSNSITSQSISIGTTKALSSGNSIKFETSANDNNTKSLISSIPSSTQLISSTNMFSPPITASSKLNIPSFSSGMSSSALQIPQFSSSISSSAPLPIPNFSQTNTSFLSQPSLQPLQQTNAFASEASQSFFSVGAMTSNRDNRRSTQNSRLRRQKR